MIDPAEIESIEDTWQRAGDVAQTTVADIANKAKDAVDEAKDAQRVHGGQTLDEFLNRAQGK